MIVKLKSIIAKAQKGRYAIGAFNTANLETTLGIIRAARANNSPAIVQISEATIKYAGLEPILNIIRAVDKSEGSKTPIAIHLDHGKDWEIVKACVLAGFSSVHMDASAYSFKDNVKITKKAVEFAHKHGVWAQGELGSLFGKEGMTNVEIPKDANSYMTDPERVKEFISSTGVDELAVSIGTMHGNFSGQENIDFKRLKSISLKTSTPLVLHGASGVDLSQIKQAIRTGITIINIDTDLRIAFTKALRLTLSKEESFYDPRKVLAPSIEAVKNEAAIKMKAFGSINKA